MPTKHALQLAQTLENEIASGILKPETRLEELALAERFGVSRTPVREALHILSASGVVVLRPRRGAVVASLNLDELLERFEVMAELEAVCSRLSAKRMTAQEREALKAQHEVCGEVSASGDSDRYYEENTKYHALICQGAHNAFLSEEVERLRRRLQPYRRLQLRLEGRIEASFQEHTAVTEAILAGNDSAAGDAMLQHVCVQADRFGDWLSTMQSQSGVNGNS
ncbi:MAG: GntR family transcriptional regulator [Filomicrobium sp.]